jgi:hypothetical protein
MLANAAISTKFIWVGVNKTFLVVSAEVSELSARGETQLLRLASGPFGLKGQRFSG